MKLKLLLLNFPKTKSFKSYIFFHFTNFCIIILLLNNLNAQNSSLDLGDLWEGKYDAERLESLRSMNDGIHFTVLEQNEISESSAIAELWIIITT